MGPVAATSPDRIDDARNRAESLLQYARNQYVVVEPDELDQLRSERDKAINVDRFVPADAIDPVYHSGHTYYLLPDGAVGRKPYALLRQTMAETGLNAIAKIVFSNREQLVLVRPVGKALLGMTMLEYAAQVKQPAAFADEVADADIGRDEAKLARQLLEGMTIAELDLAQYHSAYVERLKALIETRVQGEELVAPPAEPTPPVINLMEALKASVAQVRKPMTAPPRKMSASARTKNPAKRQVLTDFENGDNAWVLKNTRQAGVDRPVINTNCTGFCTARIRPNS